MGGQLGCLSLIICHVESLLGATPSERRVRHAFPYIPSLASVIAYSMVLFGSESYLLGVAMAFSLARFQRIPNSFLDQRSQRVDVFVGFCQCAEYCKLVHLAHSTPPSLISDGLALFDADVRRFSKCTGIDTADTELLQVQLSLGRGGGGVLAFAVLLSVLQLLISITE